MQVDVTNATRADVELIAALLDTYLRELSSHSEVPVGATDAASYPYLDAYWAEPGRHAFLIRVQGRVVGFALIRTPTSTGSGAYELAEFYIRPESRRLGIGRSAAQRIWQLFPGFWEVQVHARNRGAIQFWSTCARHAACDATIAYQEFQAPDGRRLQLNFAVRHAA